MLHVSNGKMENAWKCQQRETNKRIHSCPILTFSWHSFCDLLRSFAFPSHCLHVGCYDCNDSCVLTTTLVFSWSDEMCCVKKWTLRPWVLCLHHGTWVRRPEEKGEKCTRMTFVNHLWNMCEILCDMSMGICLWNHISLKSCHVHLTISNRWASWRCEQPSFYFFWDSECMHRVGMAQHFGSALYTKRDWYFHSTDVSQTTYYSYMTIKCHHSSI